MVQKGKDQNNEENLVHAIICMCMNWDICGHLSLFRGNISHGQQPLHNLIS